VCLKNLILKKPLSNINDKFCSFLKYSVLPRSSRYKFPFILNNSKLEHLRAKQTKQLPQVNLKIKKLTHNEEVAIILCSIFYAIYISILFNNEWYLLELNNEKRANFYLFLFNYSILYYFFNIILYQLYVYNIDLSHLVYSYVLDFIYKSVYLFLFSYYIFLYALNFYVLLNLGLIKYEHDKVLTPPEKWDDIPKMDLDFFDYTEFTEYNISNDSLLNYQDNIFNSFCVYEFYLDFILYFFNIYNLSFFHKIRLKKKKILKKFNKQKNYLSKVSYKEILNNKKEYYDEKFPKNYNEFLLVIMSNNAYKLDYYNFMMDIRSLMLKIPYLFFLFYAWYVVYYRNFRYNLYIRGFYFFEEYACRRKIFILHNNPYGKNKTKIFFFDFQRLWTIDHFKLYIEERIFNKW